MKKTLITAALMASVVAFAQTESTAPAAATSEAKPATEVKIVKKAKKAKKASPKALMAPAAAQPAALVIERPAAPAQTTTVAPAAQGTSAATVSTVDANAKKWGLSASVYGTTDKTKTEDIQFLTSVGGSYEVAKDIKLKVKQTFETLTAGPSQDEANREIIKNNNFRPTFADFSVASTLPGFLGSNKLPVSLNYKLISGDAIYSTTGGYGSAHAFVEGNLGIPFTLNPKWELSIDTQIRHVVRKVGTDNTNRFLAIPTLSYTVNDMVSLYQSAGLIVSTIDNERLRNIYNRAYLATGIAIAPTKGLSIDINVNQDKAIYTADSSEFKTSSFSLYDQSVATGGKTFDDVAYEATVSYSY